MSGMKEKKKVQTENQERIKTPFSEMVRKFKKQKNAVVALCFIIFLIFLAFFGSKIVPIQSEGRQDQDRQIPFL